jgi:hypothetical protein
MRMPGFSAEMPVYAKASGYRATAGATMESGVFPQQQVSCPPGKFFECLFKAGGCILMAQSGNIPGAIACMTAGAPDCLPCLGLHA